MKYTAMPVQREHMDELLGMPFGWASLALFDDQGAPYRGLNISTTRDTLRVTGKISGPKGEPRLVLTGASLSDVESSLISLGAVTGGTLTWVARGDEVEDVCQLLGKTCRAEFQITDGDQDDLFQDRKRMMEVAGQGAIAILDQMRRTPRKPDDQGGAGDEKAA
jgi:hypothetical protein